MKLFRKKRQPETLTRTEALECIPQPSPQVSWNVGEEGEVLIEYPLPIKPFFVQLARRFNKGQETKLTKQVQLDSIGSTVWLMLGGNTDVKTIIREVAVKTGLSLEEAEISVTTFLRELGRRGLILLK